MELPSLPSFSLYFNPRSPRGLRQTSLVGVETLPQFQSTQPKRAATSVRSADFNNELYFNPRSPRGLRPKQQVMEWAAFIFQSTQPKRAATPGLLLTRQRHRQFQSTQPKRAATRCFSKKYKYCTISIHAAQEGCDYYKYILLLHTLLFQSTQPKRAATV